jgi:1-aminocyclopropane-1-carboxylate deaminase/D-cysteine desulfhydrase-like pyridoxal-dependent ACC family enzyme
VAESHQSLVPDYPRFPLTAYPSPLQRAERLEQALRDEGAPRVPRIYLKRDDLLGLALGGNKIRNLEFLIGDALARGATDLITAGRQQSNHCRLTAAACAKAGLRSHLVLTGAPPARLTGNLLLTKLLGGRIYYTGNDDRDLRQAWVNYLTPTFAMFGARAYVIGVGGSSVRGAMGHVLLAQELMRQCDEIGIRPAAIALATATGGTQAGLVAGLRKLGRPVDVIGFAVAKSARELTDDVTALSRDVSGEIGLTVDAAAINVDGRALGGGYGDPTAEAQAAIELLARTEAVVADPVYTGKGLAGMLALIREGSFAPDDTIVFVHTGGAPALFA